jgi:hypothetical protein
MRAKTLGKEVGKMELEKGPWVKEKERRGYNEKWEVLRKGKTK